MVFAIHKRNTVSQIPGQEPLKQQHQGHAKSGLLFMQA